MPEEEKAGSDDDEKTVAPRQNGSKRMEELWPVKIFEKKKCPSMNQVAQ